MNTVFYTADPHIGHRLVAGLRGFWRIDQDGVKVLDTEAHAAALAANWDAVVAPDDIVWILGDMSINSGPQVIDWIRARPGVKHLISGNHDKTNISLFGKKAQSKIAEWSPYFASIQDSAVIEIAGQPVTLHHLPFWSIGDGERARADGYVSRYKDQRPVEKPNTILLFGHIHDPQRDFGRALHVGLDAWDMQLVPHSVVANWVAALLQ